MSRDEHPCLNLAIDRLRSAEKENYAIWVTKAPYPGGYVHHDCNWDDELMRSWIAWQEMFGSGSGSLQYPRFPANPDQVFALPPLSLENAAQSPNYSTRLMQHLGISMWQWLFNGSIDTALAHSQGIAIGQRRPLRLRIEVRDPDLISFPWEIIQPQPGKPAVSLNQEIFFSRTTSDVDQLPPQRNDRAIRILLVLGNNEVDNHNLSLAEEAAAIAQVLRNAYPSGFVPTNQMPPAACQVDTLVQPTLNTLMSALDNGVYNLFFYAGHGIPGPDGGILSLRSDAKLNGTELAQTLVRNQVKLAVFNSCWGAQPYQYQQQSVARSSLAEVLLHHGVPAILAMRDTIADQEAISFIQSLTQSLAERLPIDKAVATARKQLLALYQFNQPAWTLPVLYMHPEFDGELIKPVTDAITEMPFFPDDLPMACLRSLITATQNFPIQSGLMRVGRSDENDLIIPETWVSKKHAEIMYRNSNNNEDSSYFLRDFSKFGTMVQTNQGWQKIHHQELRLETGMNLKFGSDQGQALEFFTEK